MSANDWIKASPEKIAVGQTTVIQASWTLRNIPPTILIADPTVLADTCTGRSTRSPTVEGTTTLVGCSSGSTTVQLWDEAGNKALATVTVTVMSVPTITSATRIGYRFFSIDWSAHSYFVDFHVEWRNEGDRDSDWERLGTTGLYGPRAIIQSWVSTADVRGLIYQRDLDVEVRIVALTEDADTLETASPVYSVERGEQPKSYGHLPDHTMQYVLTSLPTTGDHAELAGWIKVASTWAAQAWARVVPSLQSCLGSCGRNRDRETWTVDLSNTACVQFACVPNPQDWVEGKLNYDRTIYFVPSTPSTQHEWTNYRSRDEEDAPIGLDPSVKRVYLWVDRIAMHEFGHAYGMADRYGGIYYDAKYHGIMKVGDAKSKSLTQDDRDSVISVYKTHTLNEGW